VAFGTNCRSAPVPFIFLRHYCTQMRVDLFCFLDAAEFFWTTIDPNSHPLGPPGQERQFRCGAKARGNAATGTAFFGQHTPGN
jgi:hypothetical protein